jgi:hypothetical protein
MPLTSDALTTVEKARLYVRRLGSQTDADDQLELLINAYSKAIRNYTLREFVPKTPAADSSQPVTRLFRYDGEGSMTLAPYELRSLGGSGYGGTGGIVLYSDLPSGSQQTLQAQAGAIQSQYRLGPRNGTTEGTYLWMELPRLRGQGSTGLTGYAGVPGGHFVEGFPLPPLYYEIEVAVTGYWGAGTVPADVELACLVSVANGFRNPEGFGSRALGDISIAEIPDLPGDDSALPASARKLLAPYRRKAARLVTV